ncbi:DUF2207 domain-containing protein [Clostridium sp. D46t1_190503_E9]|uniref:DUF2207 domain-containing protein n=1 Tax=Clostridium sp. D46t1_190503_E9 TaxID=2787137 RepID=UPI001896F806|nr:DUF2207 domain-containing protein [Clostridium sp. D46t1_190503_E9]
MKKLIFFLTLLFSLTIPITVFADSKNYSIDKLLINAEIQNNGDVLVNDEFTYTFNGDFNGIYLNLNLNGSNGYSINNVTLEDSTGSYNLENKNDKSNNSYEIINTDGKVQVKIYSKSSNEEKKFKVEYLISSAAKKYEGFSSLNWSFYTASADNPVNNVELNLKLNSANFNANNLYYTVYGDGIFNAGTSEDKIKITGENLTSNFGLDLGFQSDFLTIPITTSPIENNNNSNIIDNNINGYLEKDSSDMLLPILIPSSLILLIAIIFYLAHKRSKRIFNEALNEYRSNFVFIQEDMLPYPPSNTSPALVAYLYNKNNINWPLVPSTLMYLANKGFYILDSSISDGDELINVKFKRIKESSKCEYSHLKVLMDWFKKYEDSNNEFSFESIKKKINNSQKVAKKFNNSYYDFINEVKQNGKSHNYYISIKNKEVLNNDAYNEYLKWSAYKKYLLSLINTENIDNIKESIIYAPALGISHYDLDIDTPNGDSLSNNNFNHTFYSCYMTNLFLFNEIHNSVNENYGNDTNFNNSMDFSNNSFNDFSSGGDFSGGGGGDSGAF